MISKLLIASTIIIALGLMMCIVHYGRYMYESGFETGVIAAACWVKENTDFKDLDATYNRVIQGHPDKAIYTSEYIGGSIFRRKSGAKPIELPNFDYYWHDKEV